MGKIVIVEETADKIVNKLEKVKDCITEVIDCFSEYMDGSDGYLPVGYNSIHSNYSSQYPVDSHNDEWDDEYEVKRRRGNRRGYNPKIMRMYDDRMTRY